MELRVSFPKRFNIEDEIEPRQNLKDRLIAQLQFIATDEAVYLNRIKQADDYFTTLFFPKNFDNTYDNVIVKQRKQFSLICAAMRTQGIVEPEKLTIFKFFTTIEYFESRKQQKP